jgi:hypothetical protein
MAKERLRLPARMKGGGIKREADTRYPTFMGALLDILPRCVDKKESNGEITKGIYSEELTLVIGEGAYDEDGHMNTQFLEATRIGPYPKEMQKAWDELSDEAADNYGFQEGLQEEEAREKTGPLAEPTPAMIRNKGSAERTKARRVEAFVGGRSETATGAAREEGMRREEGVAQQHLEEGDASEEDMYALMEAVAEAISQTEREAATAQAEATGEVPPRREAEAALTREEEREAEARRRASNFYML